MYKISNFEKASKKIDKIGKILSIIICIITLFLIIFNITLIIESYIKPNELPSFLGIKSLVIISESMEPTFKKNDIIFIIDVNQTTLKVGDIISFKTNDYINTHRIVRIEENGEKIYITKGDNNTKEDIMPVKFNDIEGKFLFKFSYFGKITNLLKSKIILILLLIFLLLIFYNEVRISKRKLKRKEIRNEFNNKLINKKDENRE